MDFIRSQIDSESQRPKVRPEAVYGILKQLVDLIEPQAPAPVAKPAPVVKPAPVPTPAPVATPAPAPTPVAKKIVSPAKKSPAKKAPAKKTPVKKTE